MDAHKLLLLALKALANSFNSRSQTLMRKSKILNVSPINTNSEKMHLGSKLNAEER